MNELQIRQVFAANLRRFLREKNIKQKTLAEKLHISNEQVSRWVTAKNPPSWEMVALICSGLNVSPADLFEDHGIKDEDIFTDTDLEMFKKFRMIQRAFTKVS